MKGRCAILIAVVPGLLLVMACAGPDAGPAAETETKPAGTLTLSSTAFAEGEDIPAKYSCDGDNVSPPLAWSEPPEGTRALALIMDDPDAPAGVFNHWVIFNLPAYTRQLREGMPTDAELSDGTLQGRSSFGRVGYGGPCPPAGPSHRYRLTLYAVDEPLQLAAVATREQVLDAMRGHILAQDTLTGRYRR